MSTTFLTLLSKSSPKNFSAFFLAKPIVNIFIHKTPLSSECKALTAGRPCYHYINCTCPGKYAVFSALNYTVPAHAKNNQAKSPENKTSPGIFVPFYCHAGR